MDNEENLPAEENAPAHEGEEPSPAPLAKGPTPDHISDPGDMVAARMAPDGRGVARVVQTNHPVLGGVEGNIAMPVEDAPVAYPFAKMGVGDSFNFEGITGAKVLAAAEKWVSEVGAELEFAIHEHAGKERIWRVR